MQRDDGRFETLRLVDRENPDRVRDRRAVWWGGPAPRARSRPVPPTGAYEAAQRQHAEVGRLTSERCDFLEVGDLGRTAPRADERREDAGFIVEALQERRQAEVGALRVELLEQLEGGARACHLRAARASS